MKPVVIAVTARTEKIGAEIARKEVGVLVGKDPDTLTASRVAAEAIWVTDTKFNGQEEGFLVGWDLTFRVTEKEEDN